MPRKFLLRWVLPFCAILALLGGVGWEGSERALHPGYNRYKWTLATYPDLHPENVTIHSQTGVNLVGRFFPGASRAAIVLVHGYGDTQDQMLPYAEFLHGAGFSVFTYDMRSRGASGGSYVTLGVLEQKDMVSVVDAVDARPDVDGGEIGALGISMGGAVSILAAAQDKTIRAVVDDCGFSDAPNVIASSFEYFIHLPAFPFAPITLWIADERAGIDVNSVRPMDVIGRISPRPVFIIHGLADYVVPVANSERNFEHAREPKQIWLVPGAKHGAARETATAEYQRRVIAFFRHALGTAAGKSQPSSSKNAAST